ncbi:MAG: tetratricopeptide repeat protein [bacterium]|nr:tetratricopeptide repeat protein [bacterium]
MSKKKQGTKKGAATVRSTPTALPKVPSITPPESPNDPLLKKIFQFSIIGMVLLASLLSLGTGINGDDEYQVDYSEKLVDYYTSFGADTAALYIEKGNMHYYGGFFDLTTGLINAALGFDEFDTGYHQVRHVFNALMGMLAVLFVGLFVRQIAGWRAAVLAIWLLFLSPRFLGHSMMNPKDIPFAAGFAVSLYYMVRVFRTLPKPDWRNVLGLALGIGLALATRAGGLLLIAYLGLFAGLDFLFKYGVKGLTTQTKLVGQYLVWCLGAAVAGYIVAVLFWPAALVDPVGHPLAALTEFAQLGVKIRLLFEGENVMSDDTAWSYPLVWIVKTIPLYVLVGFLGSLFLLPRLLSKYDKTAVLLAYFATIFPVAYIIYKDSILHDGWRHLMFIYPSMIAVAALFWINMEDLLSNKKPLLYGLYGLLGLMAVESTQFIVRNPHLSYVYFNPIGGGLKGAFGTYETDYWGISVKQAIDWMEDEGILSENMQDTLRLATTFYYPASRQTREQFNGKVKMEYVRFSSRYDEPWDYAIFPSRFIRGAHLRSENWPTSKSVHTVTANGVPIATIEKNETLAAYNGQQAIKQSNWQEAIRQFTAEVQNHPDNEIAWIGLSNAYINAQQYNEALNAAQKALEVAPDVESAILYQGLAYLNTGRASEALQTFDYATRVNDEYFAAYYYMGLIHQQQQRYREAYENAQKAIEANPRFRAGYQLAAQALQALGDNQNAQRYLEAAQKL